MRQTVVNQNKIYDLYVYVYSGHFIEMRKVVIFLHLYHCQYCCSVLWRLLKPTNIGAFSLQRDFLTKCDPMRHTQAWREKLCVAIYLGTVTITDYCVTMFDEIMRSETSSQLMDGVSTYQQYLDVGVKIITPEDMAGIIFLTNPWCQAGYLYFIWISIQQLVTNLRVTQS